MLWDCGNILRILLDRHFSFLKKCSFCIAMFLNSATSLRILWWIQLISNLLLSFISLLSECNHPFAFFQSTFFFLPRQKQNKTVYIFFLGGGGESGGISITIFSFFWRFFSLFPLYFPIFHADLPSHLSFSCVLSKGWGRSSLLIYSFIFENKNHDWLIVFSSHHLSTCPHLFLSLWFPSSFSMHFLLFCYLLFVSPLWLYQIPWSPLSSFPSCLLPPAQPQQRTLQLGWAAPAAAAGLGTDSCLSFLLLPVQWHSAWVLMWFASFYFGVSPFKN